MCLPDSFKIQAMQRALILILFPFLCLNLPTYATHIVGGNISYKCLGPTPNGNMKYKITLYVYRDITSTAPFDNPAILGIYTGSNGNQLFSSLNLSTPVISQVPIDLGNPCLIVPPNVGVEEAIYKGTVELPINTDGYWISYQRCCRNGSVGNLNTPGMQGGTYTIFISGLAQQQCNSSPTFNDFPPIVICIDRILEFDHSATDIDGNTLAYEFCSPFTGGAPNIAVPNPPAPPPYAPVQFGFGFSATYPMVANPALNIDPNTGLLTGVPTAIGQYSVGICVKEFDAQGNLLSTTLRDFQFNVTRCDDQVQASIPGSISPTTGIISAQFCEDSVITFNNRSGLVSFINSYEWRFDLGNGNIFTSSASEPTVTFPGDGNYQGWLVANPGSTGCTDTAILDILISTDLTVDFGISYDSCALTPVVFTNQSISVSNSITGYFWNFGDGTTSNLKAPNHLYNYPDTGTYDIRLKIVNAIGCTVETNKRFNWIPKPILPIELIGDTACVPVDASRFISSFYPIPGYDFAWNFGDGTTSGELTTNHTYTLPGIYNRKLSITSPFGCTETFSSMHLVLDTPSAAFSFAPELPTSLNPNVQFTDESESVGLWEWQFANGSTQFSYSEGNIAYTFPDTGQHLVSLIVTHKNGCKDTVQQIVDVIPQYTYFLPNALTPNDDGKNDVYKGKGYTQFMKSFELSIYSRWGELMFQTNNPSEAWNGRKNNVGKKCQAGVYVVVVRIVGPRGKKEKIKGFATIVY